MEVAPFVNILDDNQKSDKISKSGSQITLEVAKDIGEFLIRSMNS